MEPFQIRGAPPAMFYISNFISEEEETFLLNNIPVNRWVTLSHRRLQAVPARLSATNTLLASPLPEWLRIPIVKRFNELGIFNRAPHGVNHCLINEYLPGQGIMAHEDGAAYYPVVATISLAGSIVLDIKDKVIDHVGDVEETSQNTWRILQEPRSLLVTTGSAYTDFLHGIADITTDTNLDDRNIANWSLLGDKETVLAAGGVNERTRRVSLTFRDVRKVSTIGSKLFGKGKT